MSDKPYDAFLTGERVYLRSPRDEDAQGAYPGWFNDAEVCRGNSHHVHPYTREDALAYIRDVRGRRDCLVLAIALVKDDRHIGNVALQRIDPISRSAEFAIVVGDAGVRGGGYGKEAARLIVAHGFAALNLHRIHCGTIATNKAMLALAVELGMREEGRRREAAFKDGRYVDFVEFGLLRSEFDAAPRAQAP